MPRCPQPEGVSSHGSQSSRIFEMLGQQLPIASILTNTRMRIVFQNLHSSSRGLLTDNNSREECDQHLRRSCPEPQTSIFLGCERSEQTRWRSRFQKRERHCIS